MKTIYFSFIKNLIKNMPNWTSSMVNCLPKITIYKKNIAKERGYFSRTKIDRNKWEINRGRQVKMIKKMRWCYRDINYPEMTILQSTRVQFKRSTIYLKSMKRSLIVSLPSMNQKLRRLGSFSIPLISIMIMRASKQRYTDNFKVCNKSFLKTNKPFNYYQLSFGKRNFKLGHKGITTKQINRFQNRG